MIANLSRIIKISDIEKHISQEQILMYYYGIKVPCKMPSVFRPDEKHPSMCWSYSQSGTIRYMDFGDMSNNGDVYEFLSKMWQLSLKDTLWKIWNDIIDIGTTDAPRGHYIPSKSHRITNQTHNDSTIRVKSRMWQSYDTEYWNSYGCDIDVVRKADIVPISYFWIGDVMYKADRLSYCFREHKDGITTKKIYQPFNDAGHKWFSNNHADVWFCWTMLPSNGDTVIITSSMKDCINIMSNMHIPATAMQGEGYSPKESVINELKSRFSHVGVFFDNDYTKDNNPGQTYAKSLCDKYGLYNICIPTNCHAKDPSDLYKAVGRDMYIDVMKSIIYDKTV